MSNNQRLRSVLFDNPSLLCSDWLEIPCSGSAQPSCRKAPLSSTNVDWANDSHSDGFATNRRANRLSKGHRNRRFPWPGKLCRTCQGYHCKQGAILAKGELLSEFAARVAPDEASRVDGRKLRAAMEQDPRPLIGIPQGQYAHIEIDRALLQRLHVDPENDLMYDRLGGFKGDPPNRVFQAVRFSERPMDTIGRYEQTDTADGRRATPHEWDRAEKIVFKRLLEIGHYPKRQVLVGLMRTALLQIDPAIRVGEVTVRERLQKFHADWLIPGTKVLRLP